MKGYTIPGGYMGYVPSERRYKEFASEEDYLEYLLLIEEF